VVILGLKWLQIETVCLIMASLAPFVEKHDVSWKV